MRDRADRSTTLRRGVATLVAIAAALCAGASSARETCTEKPVVVKIHADWCGTCRALETVWSSLRDDLGQQARLIELDVTDRVAYQQSESRADELGIRAFFDEYRARTGTIAVLDCASREPVAVMTVLNLVIYGRNLKIWDFWRFGSK